MDLSALLIGGSPWLNLVNTIYMNDGKKKDLLLNEEAVYYWLLGNNLVTEKGFHEIKDAGQLSTLMEWLRHLRGICFSILKDIEEQQELSTPVIEQMNEIVRPFRLMVKIEQNEGKTVEVYSGCNRSEDILYQIVISIVQTTQQVPFDRFKQCEHEDCILYFADTSKAGKRRWCSMETCGNRHKVNQFHKRRKQTKNSTTN